MIFITDEKKEVSWTNVTETVISYDIKVEG